MKRLKRVLLSRRSGLLLICAVGLLCLIGATVPQRSVTAPGRFAQWEALHPVAAPVAAALRFDRMYTSMIFLVTVGMLSIALGASLLRMYRTARRDAAPPAAPFNAERFRHFVRFPVRPERPRDKLLKTAGEFGYAPLREDGGMILLRKHAAGRWGATLLHGGMLVVVAGALATYLFEQRGFVQLLERDTFFGSGGDFMYEEHGPLAAPFRPDLWVSLLAFHPAYHANGEVKSAESDLLIREGDRQPEPVRIGINEPLRRGGVELYQSGFFGYTVGLRIETQGRAIPYYLSIDRPAAPGTPSAGTGGIPTTSLAVQVKLYPDPSRGTFALNAPLLEIRVQERGKEVASGMLAAGESLPLRGGTLTFSDARQWSGLIVTAGSFSGIVFAGFGLIAAGLIAVYFFPLRLIVVRFERVDDRAHIALGGIARREQALFADEFRHFAESIYLTEGMAHVESDLAAV